MVKRCGIRVLLLLAVAACAPWTARPDQIDVYSRPRQYERSRDYDVLHYRIQLWFEEKTRSFRGRTRITLAPLKDGFDACTLDAETFTVTGVHDDAGASLRFEQKPGTVTVRLPRAYRYREQLSFEVFYEASNVLIDPVKYGMSKGYDLGPAFKPETPDHPPVIKIQSFPTGARHWFPCYDHPNDKATAEIIATVKSGYQVISNGRLVNVTEDREKGEKTFHWSQEKPHSTYLFVLAAGPYVELSDPGGSPPIHYWVYPRDAADAPRSFRQTREIIRFFEQEFDCPYPWAKYDQITVPDFSGGMENTTLTALGDGTIHDEKADQDFPSHWLVAHEAAHQWFGDLVTMRDWSQTWLNESFATYCDYLYTKHSLGDDEGALDLWNKKNKYLNEARTRYRRPIVFDRWENPDQNFDRHTYEKGAAVLAMLRWVMGDEDFRRAVSHFLRKHAYSSVDTHDLEVAIRESTGQVLDWFFEQWVYKAGHPVFEVSSAWLPAARKLRLSVVQKQETSERIPVFRTPVMVGIATPSGRKSERVWIRKREEVFEIECVEKPWLVRFDEGNRLLMELRHPKPVEELLYQLSYDDAMGRMWAASELKPHTADRRVIEALRRRAREDSFWAVRREALESLAAVKDPAQVAFLMERSLDPKSDVRAAALRILGDRKDRSLAGFFAERFRAEASYVAQAEALRSIGKCGDASSLPLLREAARMKSPRNMLAGAAGQALKSIQP
jgi:aminopeptidase N